MNAPSSRSSFFWGCLLIAIAALAVFYPVYFSEFTWDDVATISVDNLHPSDSLFRIWCKPSLAILDDYMPLNYTTNWIEYRLWGLNPSGYHLVNLALHIFNAALLFYLLRRIPVRGAFLVALLFTIHPMQVSSIAWAVQRKDLLYVFFYLLAFLGWLRFEKKESVGNYLIVFALFTAAMLSKRMALTWPLAALLFCWWRVGRLELRRVLQIAPLLLYAIALSYIVPLSRALTVGSIAMSNDLPALSFLQKIILSGNNVVFYAGKLLWPLEHVPIYPLWKIDPTRPVLYLAPLAIFLAITTLWFLRNRIGRGPFAAVAFYGIGLSTILGFIPWSLMKLTYVQDHYQYLACIGPFLLLAYALDRIASRYSRKIVYPALALLLFLPLMLITRQHVLLYRDTETLFGENYRCYPTASFAVTQYAAGLVANRKYVKAYPVADHAIRLDPQSPENWRLKGKVLYALNRIPEACAAYEQSLALSPTDENSIIVYATIVMNTTPNNSQRVIPLLQGAVARNPQNYANHCLLANALYLNGQPNEALPHFEAAERLGLPPADTLYYHGKLLLERGEKAKALPLLRQACEKTQGAIPQYQEALQEAQK